jgi:hypothetical protein
MSDEPTVLQRLGMITDEILALRAQAAADGDTDTLAKLNRSMRAIGEIQMELARRDADAAECAAMERAMGERVRRSLDE